MADLDFATTILTSKAPEDVANFLPHSLSLSSALFEKNLVPWFSNYANMLMRYNHDLNQLVSAGRTFFEAEAEFGSVDKIWNCVALSVMSQVAVNDQLLRTIKTDILAPFSAATTSDYRFLELRVNAKELLEMLHHVAGDGAYSWNAKAPAILANFDNYKRYEKDVLFLGFLAYLNAYNGKAASVLSKNENAVAYILKEYNIDAEMAKYTEYMIAAKPPAPAPAPVHERGHHSRPAKPVPAVPAAPVHEKKKGKLRSKMGSILGRKKKRDKHLGGDLIPEDASLALQPLRLATSVAETRSSVYAMSTDTRARDSERQREREARRELERQAELERMRESERQKENERQRENERVRENERISENDGIPQGESRVGSSGAALAGAAVGAGALAGAAVAGTSERFAMDSRPLQPTVNTDKDLPDPHVTDHVEPNVETYSSSDEDTHRVSMLQAHNLDSLDPPRVDTDSDFRSRNTSSGKYSFEYGDEEKLSSKPTPTTTPKTEMPLVFDAPAYENGTGNGDAAVAGAAALGATAGARNSSFSSSPAIGSAGSGVVGSSATLGSRAPPPPPSRKVHAADRSLLTFQNLHSARDSVIQPSTRLLVSQTTGSSLFKQKDYFKHFAEPIGDGLNTSVAEIVNVAFKDGTVANSQVLGEIAFNYNSQSPPAALDVSIPTKFTRFLLNDSLLRQTGQGLFSLDPLQVQGRTLGGIKYVMDLPAASVPLVVKHVWKFEPHQASLIIRLALSPAYTTPVLFEGLVVSASLDPSVASTSASSKPEGSFNREANRITWRYSRPLVLSPENTEEKLIARFMTSGTAQEALAGVQVKFTVNGLPVPFAEILDGLGAPIPSVRTLSTGSYASHA